MEKQREEEKEYVKDIEWYEGEKENAKQCDYCKRYWPEYLTYSRPYGYICVECKEHIEN